MASNEWWDEFFDEDYLLLYGSHLLGERTEQEVAGVVELLGLREGERLLDLCCGDGRHSVAFQRRGLRVTGLDLSWPLLAKARERADRVLRADPEPEELSDLPPAPSGPVWVLGDARRVPLRPSFDASVMLFNALGYGGDEDTVAMLRSARQALRPGGRFLVESSHRDAMVRMVPSHQSQFEADERAGAKVLTQRWIDMVGGRVHAVFRYVRPDGSKGERRFQHRLYTVTDVVQMVRAAGFVAVDVFGGYDGRPLELDSLELVVRARAPA